MGIDFSFLNTINWQDPTLVAIGRLLFAALAGAIIGGEREKHGQPAGLRTHMILAVGATLGSILSINMAGGQFDPTRISAQIVSGIGFLGAGAIFHYGTGGSNAVKGVTTAASLWTMAIIGIAIGAGYLWIASAAALVILITLTAINEIENRYIHSYQIKTVEVSVSDNEKVSEAIHRILSNQSEKIVTINYKKQISDQRLHISAVLKLSHDANIEEIIHQLSEIKGMRTIEVR